VSWKIEVGVAVVVVVEGEIGHNRHKKADLEEQRVDKER
jgi:hypothetical protein